MGICTRDQIIILAVGYYERQKEIPTEAKQYSQAKVILKEDRKRWRTI